MKHLHLECVGGASGDMMLGALVELGVPVSDLKAALNALGTRPFDIVTRRAHSMHITGLQLHVEIEGVPHARAPAAPHDEHHHHGHHHHHDAHDHHHEPAHPPHEHRALSEINRMIDASSLPSAVKTSAKNVFLALGQAEAKIHGVPVEKIHFHEVGADDSILDIVGSCWALNQLGITSVSAGPVPQGQGTIRCAHGVYPNPAPATLELTAGMPVVQTDEPFELVTPTGAALLASWKTAASIPPGAVLVKSAYSLGQRSLHHRPNILRASLFDTSAATESSDTCLVLECNLDDTTPELVGSLIDEVLAAGALDVFCAPVTMKKQRPGFLVSVLCAPELKEKLLPVIFRGSTTFGIREYPVQRAKLHRRFEVVSTRFGDIKVKVGSWRGEDITRSPEMADCQRVAKEKGVSVREVYEAAKKA